MKFAVSNIAWLYAERLDAYAVLRDHGFSGLEIAPSLLFAEEKDPFAPSVQAVSSRVAEFERFGLELVSAQSLLFGVDGADLFGSPSGRERFDTGLARAIEFAGRLGIPNLVVGSPKQRIVPPGLSEDDVTGRVRDAFCPLGDLAAANGTRLAMEPNAVGYGTNFMTTVDETIAAVRKIGHPAVTLNFDTGALYMTDGYDDVAASVAEAAAYISHVHVSAANLAPSPVSEADAHSLLDALADIEYDRAVSIEMKAVADGLKTLKACVVRLRAAAESWS
ncbi:sugar phosphate isomerase/epimerase [Bradyrhizobium sp. CCGUVB14]|uniref:sugar phosphate isomerase/epimerase family protein n=1 Tax=Bradyrhizobium sp. CCGUVB14 TaxID=2949628 RepID=UPI0020B30FDE|nr:sugar phosphate isomerase/epimerase family protein [Bradyrhizobium sp. CCGUVB14]MCP3445126.1 sugar phosphate isomerase/epimerase [Bradyrhizobium sp. CCGUVB14]